MFFNNFDIEKDDSLYHKVSKGNTIKRKKKHMKGSIITTNTSTSTFLVLRIYNGDKGVKDINEPEFVSPPGLGYAHLRGRYHPQSRLPPLQHPPRHLHHQSQPTTHYQQHRQLFLPPPDQRQAAQDNTAPGHIQALKSTRAPTASWLRLRFDPHHRTGSLSEQKQTLDTVHGRRRRLFTSVCRSSATSSWSLPRWGQKERNGANMPAHTKSCFSSSEKTSRTA